MENEIIKKLYKLSLKASQKSEIPVSAILVSNNKIIAKAYNTRKKTNSTISHAEVKVIQQANKKLKSWRLNNCTLYVTIKPCIMCETIIKEARIKEVYYLLDRDPNKNQYNKTEFLKLNTEDSNKIIEKYLENINRFWENVRNKK